MGPPQTPPVGLAVTRLARTLSRAFDQALAEAGGSQPVWLVLLALTRHPDSTQRQLAEELDIREATLTHHLNGMERDGLVTRQRSPENRRVHQLALTDQGRAAFHRMREAAVSFDRRLRGDIPPADLTAMLGTLRQLADNVQD